MKKIVGLEITSLRPDVSGKRFRVDRYGRGHRSVVMLVLYSFLATLLVWAFVNVDVFTDKLIEAIIKLIK